MTLLTAVQQAANEIGLLAPDTVIGNTDQQVKQYLALATREGRDLAAREGPAGGWQQLRKEWTFSLVAAQATYTPPADLAFLIPQTGWDRTARWQLMGPLSPQEWQVIKSGLSPAGPRLRYRLMGGLLYIDPTPTDTDSMVLEYYSTGWCQSSGGTPQSAWAADTDVFTLPEDLLVLGLKWRFLRAKGLDYIEERDLYEQAVARELGRAADRRPLSICAAGVGDGLIGYDNIPDTGYGA